MDLKAKLEAELEALKKERDRYISIQNEGYSDGYNPYDDKISEKFNEIWEITQSIKDAEWTREVTRQRKEKWNAIVTSGKIKTVRDVVNAEKELEFTLNDLRKYVKKHGI